MTKNEIMCEAEKHCTLTAGWIFSQPDIIALWGKAYAAGAAAMRERAADLVFDMVQEERNNYCWSVLHEAQSAIRAMEKVK